MKRKTTVTGRLVPKRFWRPNIQNWPSEDRYGFREALAKMSPLERRIVMEGVVEGLKNAFNKENTCQTSDTSETVPEKS